MSAVREGTCVAHSVQLLAGGFQLHMCECEHGTRWRLGDTRAMCADCVQGHCEHAKAGVDQGMLL